MRIFVDTSAIFAYLHQDDSAHPKALRAFNRIISSDDVLLTSNYVALETNALVQRRLGMEAAQILERDIMPLIHIVWLDQNMHKTALTAMLSSNRRNLSLIDCTSFDIMRREGIGTVLTLDSDFADQGFKVLPSKAT